MDLLSSVLATLRLDAKVFLHASFCKSWVIDVGHIEVATFHVIARGGCWLHLPHTQPVALREGDLLFLPHNAPHLVACSQEPPTPDTPVNNPAAEVSGPSATLVCGTVSFSQNYWNPLVEALPEYLIVHADEASKTTLGKAIEAIVDECERAETGSEVIIDRLADILFIEVVRSYAKKTHHDSYLAAVADPRIGSALSAFHQEPGRDWSVGELSEQANMSRSAFAERFQKLVGSPPMNYVTRWRMHHAHNLITDRTDAIAVVAEQSGYQSEDAFARAFRREFGMSPAMARRREVGPENVPTFAANDDPLVASKVMYSPLEANRLRLSAPVVFVDIRDPEEYAAEHIPGAVNIPELFLTLSLTTPPGLQEMEDVLVPLLRKAGISGGETVIVYENDLDTQFGGSCRGYFQLCFFGHPNPGILDGGFDRWRTEGFPTDSKPTRPIPAVFTPRINRSCMATVDDVIFALEHHEVKVLDNRDKQEWLGITSAPTEFYPADFLPRTGRIPGARWIEWHKLMESKDGTTRFKARDQIRALCAQAGLYPDDHIIVYCFKGARSSNTWVALKLAGFKHVRNYYGSWNEWSRNSALPSISVRLAD
jgi:thiosulfate/3-mercaptopyruvate sulfurtransferase